MIATTVGLIAAGTAIAPAASASAATDCWRPKQTDFSVVAVAIQNTVTHDGPYGACGDGRMPGGYVYASCKYRNSAGNWWYFTDWGWIYGAKYIARWPYGQPNVTCTKY